MDVNGQWVSGDRGSRVVWDFHHSEYTGSESPKHSAKKGLKTWKVKREVEQLLTEYQDRSEWGTLHFTAPDVRQANVWSYRF